VSPEPEPWIQGITNLSIEALQSLQIHVVIHIASVGAAAPVMEQPQRPKLLEMIGNGVGGHVEPASQLAGAQIGVCQQAHDGKTALIRQQTKEVRHMGCRTDRRRGRHGVTPPPGISLNKN
jgi:hypothetical protein